MKATLDISTQSVIGIAVSPDAPNDNPAVAVALVSVTNDQFSWPVIMVTAVKLHFLLFYQSLPLVDGAEADSSEVSAGSQGESKGRTWHLEFVRSQLSTENASPCQCQKQLDCVPVA